MSTKTEKNTTQKAKAPKEPKTSQTPQTSNVETPPISEVIAPVGEKRTLRQKQTNIPLSYVIPVRSAVEGVLVYVSRKNGYSIQWENYGVLEYLAFEDLVAMRNSAKSFFVNNWIFIEDTEDFSMDEIYRALQVDKYYTDVLEIDDIDDILNLDYNELATKLPRVSKGIKDALVTRAKRAIMENNPVMDSIRKRELIEQECNVELIPKEI